MNPILSKWSGCYLSSPRSRMRAAVFASYVAVLSTVIMLVALLVAACSPAQRSAEEKALDLGTKAIGPVCVIVRAVSPSGTAREICATAEELAPLVDELIRARLEAASSTSSSSAPLVVAASLPAPKKKIPRRHCAAWVAIDNINGSASDGGSDAGRRNEADDGGDGAGFAGRPSQPDDGGAKSDSGGGGGH